MAHSMLTLKGAGDRRPKPRRTKIRSFLFIALLLGLSSPVATFAQTETEKKNPLPDEQRKIRRQYSKLKRELLHYAKKLELIQPKEAEKLRRGSTYLKSADILELMIASESYLRRNNDAKSREAIQKSLERLRDLQSLLEGFKLTKEEKRKQELKDLLQQLKEAKQHLDNQDGQSGKFSHKIGEQERAHQKYNDVQKKLKRLTDKKTDMKSNLKKSKLNLGQAKENMQQADRQDARGNDKKADKKLKDSKKNMLTAHKALKDAIEKELKKMGKKKGKGKGKGKKGDTSENPLEESNLPKGKRKDKDDNLKDKKDKKANAAWGKMKPKEREEIVQFLKKRFPTRYRELIEAYYKAIAERDNGR